jgi:hypothetical protein
VEGIGNFYDYGMRGYDPRIGRFPSVDPLTKTYPWYSPYQYAGNKPVWKRDIDGMEEEGAEGREADDKELEEDREKEEVQAKLRNALKTPTAEEEARARKEFEESLKETPRQRAARFQRFVNGVNNYAKNGFNSAQIVFAGTTQQSEVNSNDLQKVSNAQRAAVGGAQALVKIYTERGLAEQSLSKDAFDAVGKVNEGVTLYRIGTLGSSHAGEAQYWSLENPSQYLNNPEEFAQRYGIPASNLKSGEVFIEAGKLQPGARFITREAPGVGANKGGAIEVVTDPGSVKLESFNVLKN